MKNYQKTKLNEAFTLAEVLITLLIIGIVASITIPALITETEKAEVAAQVKKYQSILQQAAININNEYGGLLNSPLSSNEDHDNSWMTFKNQLNLRKDCGSYTGRGCWINTAYKTLHGTTHTNWDYIPRPKGMFQDGSSILFLSGSYCSSDMGDSDSGPLNNTMCAYIAIDVNGYKLPNQAGRDVFAWYILQNGTVCPVGIFDDEKRGCDPESTDTTYTYGTNGSPGLGLGCTLKVIQDGKITY